MNSINRSQRPYLSDKNDSKQLTSNELLVGIDIGSTTTKVLVYDPLTKSVVRSSYRRHNAHQIQSVIDELTALSKDFSCKTLHVCFCGSGGATIAQSIKAPYVQEVVANSLAIKKLYPCARCAIELGGQDAKMIFFTADSNNDVSVADMRMNGSCAGGTGAFLDEIAALLKIPVEKLNDYASKGEALYDISGRCGVYAKTDIQPLLNQGARKEDIARSAFHALAKQTIGGLAQGLDIHPPVIFEGGPLTFNPELVRVFAERLNLSDSQIIYPHHPEMMMAYGSVLFLEDLYQNVAKQNNTNDSDTCSLVNSETIEALEELKKAPQSSSASAPFFTTNEERIAFTARHKKPQAINPSACSNNVLPVYIGIDSGSTTTKFALINEQEELIDSFYASNEGDPLTVAVKALKDLHQRYLDCGISLHVLGVGTTGYGELLFAKAFHADHHVVETVAHAHAACHYVPNADFILDIGGQDMKAIWLDNGVITDIVVNEACSSGCGSFLESFASTLNIATDEIAEAAFSSTSPAELGSRCTVFMNSSIVSEQRKGKTPNDIMAGLCRSIIENVFTKVIRVSNLDSLGNNIVVQGGTFNNDAVLCALEQYINKEVTRAPYPGLMGALGVALLTKKNISSQSTSYKSSFIGLENLASFTYSQQSGLTCPFCANHCKRTQITFSDGSTFITGNRCSKGEIIGNPKEQTVKEQLARLKSENSTPNVFTKREALLFKEYPCDALLDNQNITIGIPRVLSFWDSAPFWTTLFRSLGFNVKLSAKSSRKLYESGLSAVTSDTVCFPAKLVHGHIRNLEKVGVDRIFMPVITTVPSENTAKTSQSMCAVVKGFPIVVRNSDNPESRSSVVFDSPLFHWYSNEDRNVQLCKWLYETFSISEDISLRAISCADKATDAFRQDLLAAGEAALTYAQKHDTYAIVLASRPYHNDSLVNHDLPELFGDLGIAVLPPDALPGTTEVPLEVSRLDIVNNYHARTLSSALIAATNDNLESVQLVSFGCGHDAYLSDEIVRLMKEAGAKSPLILKVDESDIQGPLRIRVRSFIETINARRELAKTAKDKKPCAELSKDPYAVKYVKAHRKEKVILVPNTSHAFCRLMSAAMIKQGVRAEALEIGREEAIRLGKQYVHNDICFPAQIVIGEALAALESGKYNDKDIAIGTGKYVGDCRLTHYSALLRKALNDAGYEHVPIITNDDKDDKNLHPGFKLSALSAMRIAIALPMIDVLEELLRKIRPYELTAGSANFAFEKALDVLIEGLEQKGIRGAIKGFKDAILIMKSIAYDRSVKKPQVLIVGEYLLNFHPGANHDIEDYLERNGLEIIEARMTDVIRKSYFYKDAQVKEFDITMSAQDKLWYAIANKLFDIAHDITDSIAKDHPLYTPVCRMPELVKASDPIIHHTFDAGEGVLIPGEILHHAAHGCRAFVILQPFGCLPNHVCGRGISKRLKELYPDAQILPLDYDPDVSFANLENRLQMLIMNAQQKQNKEEHLVEIKSHANYADSPVYKDKEQNTGKPRALLKPKKKTKSGAA